MNKYAFFDVDKTIYNGFSANDFIEHAVQTNFCEPEMKERMDIIVQGLISKELSYHNASQKIMDLLGDIVEGKTEREVSEVVDSVVQQKGLNEWFKPIYNYLKENNYEIYLVSGGASFIINRIAKSIDEQIIPLSTEYTLNDGRYTNEPTTILNGELKGLKLREILGEKGNRNNVFSIAFGDSSGDIDMLKEVDQGYLYRPNPTLMEIAKQEGFNVFNDESEIYIPEVDNTETSVIA
jgi:HAD superfamily phosphoserine phosphatase-like hydrolase